MGDAGSYLLLTNRLPYERKAGSLRFRQLKRFKEGFMSQSRTRTPYGFHCEFCGHTVHTFSKDEVREAKGKHRCCLEQKGRVLRRVSNATYRYVRGTA